jgi:hypothetical protein
MAVQSKHMSLVVVDSLPHAAAAAGQIVRRSEQTVPQRG